MAKEIPYFKFYTGDWSNGDITLETYDLQGIFINVCAYYWSKDCLVSLDNVKKKFRGLEEKIDALISSGCIKVISENISINFLNEQFSSKEIQMIANRKNGCLGGRPIGKKTEKKPNGLIFANPNKSETKPKPNPTNNPNITNIENSIEDIVSNDTIVGQPKVAATVGVSFESRCLKFIEFFNKKRGTKYQVTDNVRKALKARLKNYSSEQISLALENSIKDKYHVENNFQYLTPAYLLRAEIIERYINTIVKNGEPVTSVNPYKIDHSKKESAA